MENGPQATQTTANSVVTTQPAENGFANSFVQTKQPISNPDIISQPVDNGCIDPGEVWLSNGIHADPRKTNGHPNKKENKQKNEKKNKYTVDSIVSSHKHKKRSIYSDYNPDPILDDSGCDLLGLLCCVSCCSCDCDAGDGCCGDGCDIDLNCCD